MERTESWNRSKNIITEMMKQREIMLVEDDESLGFLIKDSLDAHGWKVKHYSSGEQGLTAFHNNQFDLCILDIMLPQQDGISLATEIRKYNQQVPIVFLTAKSQTEDRIRGFQSGADDYVCKPFSIEEFKYRLEAILKRSHDDESTNKYSVLKLANTTLDIHNLLLNANGTTTRLTHKECKLLQLFLRHAGKLIEREVFLKSIWEDDGFFVARSMDVFISKLRKYLSADKQLRIENIRGVGYILKTGRE
jgi:DNA-binding response OmpR family regulator